MEREEKDTQLLYERSETLSSLNEDIKEMGFVVNKNTDDN